MRARIVISGNDDLSIGLNRDTAYFIAATEHIKFVKAVTAECVVQTSIGIETGDCRILGNTVG